ncbi:MAG: (2Fe-2S)-binding protein [Victivallales bacterium]|nr:(2Fe-2S)-binding protein [Victivallales bacterium]
MGNYNGVESPFEKDDDHEGKIICNCFGVSDVKILKVAKENNLHKAEEVTDYCKAGGACGACLDDIQHLLDDMWKLESAKKC